MTGAAADAEQAGLFGVGQAHQRARRQREQLAAVGLAHEFGGNGQFTATQLQWLTDLEVQRHQRAVIEIDLTRRRCMTRARTACCVTELQRAAQRIVRPAGQHIEQLGLLVGERHAGEACRSRHLQMVLIGLADKVVRHGLR